MLTVTELGKKLRLSRQTIYRMMKEGMPHIRIGKKTLRFDEAQVMEWIRNNNSKEGE